MDEKGVGRRTFLRSAALASAAVAVGGGIPAAFGQGSPETPSEALVPRPAGDNAPEDDYGEALRPLFAAAVGEAMAKADAVIEKVVRKASKEIDVEAALAATGLKLTSPGAKKAARKLQTPSGLLKKSEEAKTEGWHSDLCFFRYWNGICASHSHVSW